MKFRIKFDPDHNQYNILYKHNLFSDWKYVRVQKELYNGSCWFTRSFKTYEEALDYVNKYKDEIIK